MTLPLLLRHLDFALPSGAKVERLVNGILIGVKDNLHLHFSERYVSQK